MELTWGIAAIWLGLALVASLLSIRFKMSVALVEIVPTMVAQAFFMPQIEPSVAFAIEQGTSPGASAPTDEDAPPKKSSPAPMREL